MRFTKLDGTPGEARRASFVEAEALAIELSGYAAKAKAGTAVLADRPVAELVEEWLSGDIGAPTYAKTCRT